MYNRLTTANFFTSLDTPDKIHCYADAGFMSDFDKGRSQTGFVIMYMGAAIVWKSEKQTTTATSTNHSEIIALYEATRDCVWINILRKTICNSAKLDYKQETIKIYEDNAACIKQVESGFIKSNKTKHILSKYFYTTEINGNEITVTPISSSENVADIFTKTLSPILHWKHARKLGLIRKSELMS